MNTKSEISYIEGQIESLQSKLRFLTENAEFLDTLKDVGCFESCGTLHLSNCNRDAVVAIVKQFGGRWIKHYRDGEVDYIPDHLISGAHVEIYGGEPPQSCRVVEEEVEVPACKKIVRRIVCNEPDEVLA